MNILNPAFLAWFFFENSSSHGNANKTTNSILVSIERIFSSVSTFPRVVIKLVLSIVFLLVFEHVFAISLVVDSLLFNTCFPIFKVQTSKPSSFSLLIC